MDAESGGLGGGKGEAPLAGKKRNADAAFSLCDRSQRPPSVDAGGGAVKATEELPLSCVTATISCQSPPPLPLPSAPLAADTFFFITRRCGVCLPVVLSSPADISAGFSSLPSLRKAPAMEGWV